MSKNPWGPDVSRYQGDVNWKAVKKAGASFAFVKATQGTSWVDTKFNQNWPAIYKAGIMVRGAYHYAEITGDPIAQARHYVESVKKAGGFHKGDFAVLDAEDVSKESYKVSPEKTAEWCMRWLDEVVRLTGLKRRRVLLYTGMWWWTPRTGNDDRVAKAGHPLWLSYYRSTVGPTGPWRTWRFWQYTNGTNPASKPAGIQNVPGIGRCDVNLFNGTARGLWWTSGRPLKLFKG